MIWKRDETPRQAFGGEEEDQTVRKSDKLE
jgi:hypothetical protein